MLKTGELLVERRRGPVVPNLPLARWCSRLHLDLARLGPAPPRSSRPCASSLISALRLLAHLGLAPPRSSRPCASSLLSALRLLAHLGLAPSRSSRPCASSAHLFDSGIKHGDVAPYFAAAAPSLLAPLARPAPPPPLALAAPLVQHLTRRLLATRPTPRSIYYCRLLPVTPAPNAPVYILLSLNTGDARRTYCWC